MKLGLQLRPSGSLPDTIQLAKTADELGYATVWVPEAYGVDAVSLLAWIGAQTTQIGLGSGVLQIPARTPAMTAMTAASLDCLSGGRFRLGLGLSGPQVSEGWHGVRYDHPLERTREYVDIVKLALSRKRVQYQGRHFTLPLPDGPGKALALTIRPVRAELPIYLAALGPRNLELAGEIADGWLGILYTPEYGPTQLEAIKAGHDRTGRDWATFDRVASVPLVGGATARSDMDGIRQFAALYVGGMGSREQNFYHQLAGRMGYEAAAAEIQNLYLARDYDRAAAAVPDAFVQAIALIGDTRAIADRMVAFAESGITTLSVMPMATQLQDQLSDLRLAADALSMSGVGG